MISTRLVLAATCSTAFIALSFLTKISASAPSDSQPANRVFEIRTYTAADGKLDALLDRFRNHTVKLFEKHGMTNIGYWIPQDEPKSKNTLVYILSHESRDAAKKNWAEFQSDPDWQKVKADSESVGPLVTHIDVIYADPTNFSPLK